MSKLRVLSVVTSVLAAFLAFPSAAAQTFTTLYSFTGGADGGLPYGNLVLDAKGNLYGETEEGGDLACIDPVNQVVGCGNVFKLDPSGHLTPLYDLTGGADGYTLGHFLARDSAGNLYGATWDGGNLNCGNPLGVGCGTVFKVDKKGRKTVLYAFASVADGGGPQNVIPDAAGNLYGATGYGGGSGCEGSGCGTVFKVDPTGNHTKLYAFAGGSDGLDPVSVIRDAAGNLYGITDDGGNSCYGSVFKISSAGNKTTLYSFKGGTDGGYCFDYRGSLVRDSAGNLYGTTWLGGDLSCNYGQGCGVVFKVDKKGNEQVLYSFTGGKDGSNPNYGLVRDAAGNLYGGTCSSVFKLDKSGNFSALHVLHSFTQGEGCPEGLVLDKAGNLYGITYDGGAYNAGTVFKITLYPVSFSPESLTFSAQTVGTTSAPKTVTLFNNQSVALNIASIVASANYSAVPGGTKPCGSVVAANSKCTFVVRFGPTKIGTIKGAVTVTDDAPTSPQTVALTGKGQ